MKPSTNTNPSLLPLAFAGALALCPSATAFTLDPLGTGSEGNTFYSDTTPLQIDGGGNVIDPNAGNGFEDFAVTGTVTQTAAFSTSFSITLQGMASVDATPGAGLGAKLTDGGIDRDGSGNLGVRGGSNGIDALEGYLVGLDATNLNPSLAFQITGVEFAFLGAPETATIVNRNDTSKSLAVTTSGLIDVSSLDLILAGGSTDDEMVSVFGDNFAGGGSFRIVGFTIEVVNLNRFFLDSLGSGTEGDTIFSDTTALQIDGSGNVIDPNLGNGFEDFDVSGSVAQAAAFNTDFSITLQGMSSVDTTTDLGGKLADGGIDRAGNGDLGIRPGGVDQLEGILVGLDATNLDPSLSFQITGVGLAFVGDPETGTIVNRNDTSKSLGFGYVGSGAEVELADGTVDVSSLGLLVAGGSSDAEVVSVFGNAYGSGGFRVTGFTVKLVNTPGLIFLDPLGTGSEGNTFYSDTTPLQIDGSGNVIDPNAGNGFEDFAVTGTVTQANAFSTDFSITLQGMASVDATPGAGLGAKLSDGGIDRDNSGNLGIRGGAGNGIEALEGFLVGLDATNLNPSLALQITGVEFAFLGAPETATIVNRNDTSKSLAVTTSGLIDVSSLDLILAGGSTDDEIVSIFGDDFAGGGNFRIAGFRLEVVSSGGLTSLQQFRQDNGLASDGSEDDDTPASDGVENILKYAFNMLGAGTNQQATLEVPNNAIVAPTGDAGLPLIRLDGSGKLEVIYIRRKASSNPGISYEVQFGSGLDNLALNPSATESAVSIDTTFERVTVTDSLGLPGNTSRFGRVSVTATE